MSDELDIRMIVEVVKSSYGDPYYHVIARPVKWMFDITRSEWVVSNGFDYDEPHYSNLRVSAQGSLADDEPAYGTSVEYRERFSIGLGDAERMVKVLRKVQRGLDKLESQLDYAGSVGAYIARVATVLGISKFGFYPPRGEPMWMSGERVRWSDAKSLGWQIDERVKEVREAANAA